MEEYYFSFIVSKGTKDDIKKISTTLVDLKLEYEIYFTIFYLKCKIDVFNIIREKGIDINLDYPYEINQLDL